MSFNSAATCEVVVPKREGHLFRIYIYNLRKMVKGDMTADGLMRICKGVFGTKTHNVQKANGLKVDGIVGKDTPTKLCIVLKM